MGFDGTYNPRLGLPRSPIEMEESKSNTPKGKNKDVRADQDFRAECRKFARRLGDVQREEFKRLGITGNLGRSLSDVDFSRRAG